MPADLVPPTLDVATAVATDWQCIVVGAGPAGAAVAIRLARHGLRVLLTDRTGMPRPKVCGCCLSPLAVAELCGLWPPGDLPVPLPLTTVRLTAAGRSARIRMPGGGVLSREALDTALVHRAIAAGAAWLPHTLVTGVHEGRTDAGLVDVDARNVTVAAREDLRLKGRVLVIAAGLADTIRIVSAADQPTSGDDRPHAVRPPRDRRVENGSRIGLGTTLSGAGLDATAFAVPPGELVMAVGRHGYCGLVRLEDGRIDVAAAVDRPLVAGAGGPAAALVRLLREATAGLQQTFAGEPLMQALAAAAVAATPPLTHRAPLACGTGGRIFRVGDAAGYVEPFTGEGIGWALAGGRVLAESLLADPPLMAGKGRGSGGHESVVSRYPLLHGRLFGVHHARCRWVARGVRHRAVVAGALGLARIMPWAAEKALPLLVGAAISGRSSRG